MAVELVGERWALLIIRDLLGGPRRYTDLKQGLPRIPTNILSTRLKELQENGVIRRIPIPRCGLAYELTDYGRQLEPVVVALENWGFQQLGERREGDIVTPGGLRMALKAAFQTHTAAKLPATDYELQVEDVVLRIQVDGQRLDIWQLSPPAPPVGGALPSGAADAVLTAGPGFRRLISGELPPAEALTDGAVVLAAGSEDLVERFARMFHVPTGASAHVPVV